MSYYKLLLITIAFLCSSCAGKTIQDYHEQNLAAVISGCKVRFGDSPKLHSCTTTWQSNSDQMLFTNNLQIKFVNPGEYEFVKYQQYENFAKYVKQPYALSIFKKITLKPGDVIYIGEMDANFIEGNNILDSLKYVNNFQMAEKYMEQNFPELLGKMTETQIKFTNKAEAMQRLLNPQSTNKKTHKGGKNEI